MQEHTPGQDHAFLTLPGEARDLAYAARRTLRPDLRTALRATALRPDLRTIRLRAGAFALRALVLRRLIAFLAMSSLPLVRINSNNGFFAELQRVVDNGEFG